MNNEKRRFGCGAQSLHFGKFGFVSGSGFKERKKEKENKMYKYKKRIKQKPSKLMVHVIVTKEEYDRLYNAAVAENAKSLSAFCRKYLPLA